MVTVKFVRDDGAAFIIDNKTWKIPSDGLIGFDSVNVDYKTEKKAVGDGSFEQGITVTEKDRTIKAILTNRNLNKLMRDVVQRFFGVKRKFKVIVNYDGNSKYCEGRVIAFALPTENIYDLLELKVTILSTQPYLLSIDEFGQNIAEIQPRFGMPYVSLVGEGFLFGVFKFAKKVPLFNDGDVETFLKVVFVAKGTVKNPEIIKDDCFIKINDTLQNEDVVIIDLVKEPPVVEKNGKSIIGKLDRNSDLEKMKLNVGENIIQYNALAGSDNMEVIIYYNKRYGGM